MCGLFCDPLDETVSRGGAAFPTTLGRCCIGIGIDCEAELDEEYEVVDMPFLANWATRP